MYRQVLCVSIALGAIGCHQKSSTEATNDIITVLRTSEKIEVVSGIPRSKPIAAEFTVSDNDSIEALVAVMPKVESAWRFTGDPSLPDCATQYQLRCIRKSGTTTIDCYCDIYMVVTHPDGNSSFEANLVEKLTYDEVLRAITKP
jgi:hypothetical protein